LKTHKLKIFILSFLSVFILIFNKCVNEQEKDIDFRGAAYAGSQHCRGCHNEIYESYLNTAHSLTSSIPSRQTIKGSFAKDSNSFYYRPELRVEMQQNDSGFYQVAYLNNIKKKAARFDIVIGSGRKGQSYLYWHNDNIFQLPVSYYVPGKTWANSPNFPPHHVQFTRNIPVGCFECHSSYIQKTASKPVGGYLVDQFKKGTIIYGIDCERCHGPAALHVDFHENHPLEKNGKYIADIGSLTRGQKLDMCSICHSGARQTILSTFNFKPGEKLSDYLYADEWIPDTSMIDVHGKQYQLLTASKCFKKSSALTCGSCHNTHVNEKNSMKVFSQRCMSCHTTSNHDSVEMPDAVRAGIVNNCIDCHMPARPSTVITMEVKNKGAPIPAVVRTHYITIYKEATQKYFLKK
jgi:hypothetical protein